MSAGWRSVRPMRLRSEHKVVGRDVRGRPLKAAGVFFFRGLLLVSYDLQLSHFVG